MTFGFESYRTDGSVITNDSSQTGVYIESINIPSTDTTGGSKVYSMIPGGYLKYYNQGAPGHAITVDTDPGTGNARLNWSGGGSFGRDTSISIFAKKLNTTGSYGISIQDGSGNVLADYVYPVPQYIGVYTLNPTAAYNETCPDGRMCYTHQGSYGNGNGAGQRPGSNVMLLINLPDNTSDVWYSYISSSQLAQTYTIELKVFAPSGVNYVLPTMHLYAINGPVSAGTGWGVQLIDPSAKLVYDSSAENMKATDTIPVSYPDYGTTNTYNASTPTYSGVLIPYYYYPHTFAVSGGFQKDIYRGVMRRQGGQFFSKLAWYTSGIYQSVQGDAGAPNNVNSYCVVVDLAYASSGTVGETGVVAVATYPSYNNIPNLDVYELDAVPQYTIAASGMTDQGTNWHNGTGNASLYEYIVVPTGTHSQPGGAYASVNTWYSADQTNTWGLNAPIKAGFTRTCGYNITVRIKSSQTTVSTGSFTLVYDRS